MIPYRVKQFWWGVTSKFKKIDYDYVKNFLNDEEVKLFQKMNISDKHHSIRVCKDSIEILNKKNIKIDKEKLGKVALLHDIGKMKFKLNLVEKSIIVLLDKATNGKLKKYDNVKQFNIYYNHGKIGAKMLKRFKYDDEFIQAVKYHHNNKSINNKLLEILTESDNKN